ncbi:SPFH domain-containing protein [Nonomuraea ferruginea]
MIRGEFIDIIEWLDDSRDTIVWRFPRHDNEIKMGAKLVVRESQVAVFVNEGHIADAFPPGTFTLQTRNLPVLSTLKGWKYGFDSPFKAEVYFVSTRRFTDFKWGTQNPIMLRDPEFGPVRLRAFGSYSVQVTEPMSLLRELAGTDQRFRTEEVEGYLRQTIVGRLAGALGAAQVPVLDLAADQHAMGQKLADILSADLSTVGLSIPNFSFENISFPPEVEKALDKRTQMGLADDLGQYTRFQAANALENAGGADEGMGLGMGIAARPADGGLSEPARPAAAAAPPSGTSGSSASAASGAARSTRPDWPPPGSPPDALVWRAGMAQWAPARDVPELAALLHNTPPPLPPS